MAGDTRELLRQREQMLRMKRELERMIADLDERIPHDKSRPAGRRSAAMDRRPVRVLVLDCLEDLGWLTYSREMAQYSAARYGREIAASRFGPLARDEEKSLLASTKRPVWLAHGLTYDRHQPIKRLLGRSDWPLERRVVAPTSGRIQHLMLTARLSQLALEAGDSAVDPEMLRIIAADHARDLPGVKVQRGTFELQRWLDIANEELEKLLPQDEAARRESAERLRERSPLHQLFGVPDVLDWEAAAGSEAVGS